MPEESPVIGPSEEKTKFLEAFKRRKIVTRALEETGIHHGKYQKWMDADQSFREDVQRIKLEVIDEIKEIAFKKIGLLAMGPDDKARAYHKFADNALIAKFLNLDPDFRQQQMVNNGVIARLEISGVDHGDIHNLLNQQHKVPVPRIDESGHELQGAPKHRFISQNFTEKMRSARRNTKARAGKPEVLGEEDKH